MINLIEYIALGFLGGLILNVMPCVLPVLTMKVFHLLEQRSSSARTRHLHGLAYAGGIMTLFVVLAAIVIIARASGERVGWGLQFQHAPFVATLVALIFSFGLNSLGVFEWSLSLSGRPGHDGFGASYANGIFAAIMSTPCSAPFLGTAAAFALGSGALWWQTLAMFIAIGLGLASPFLVVSLVPQAGRLLPRPGPWMETFKQLMGFTLLGASVWLFGTLQAQVSRGSANGFLAFLLLLAVALWGMNRFGGVLYERPRRVAVRVAALALTVLGGYAFVDFQPPEAQARAATHAVAGACAEPVVVGDHIAWVPFDTERLRRENERKRPVFMDYTADWCANCKTNERVFVETSAVRDTLRAHNILPMKADLTNENDEIQGWLDKLGRSGIPAYVIYLPDGTRDLLPEAITTELLVGRLTEAARRFPTTCVAAR